MQKREIIKIRAEVKDIKNMKATEKSNETKSRVF